jgi:hypothetical protein
MKMLYKMLLIELLKKPKREKLEKEFKVEITPELDKVVTDMYRQTFFGVSAFSCGQKSSAVL